MDRNLLALAVWPGLLASLSARRAWIEIILVIKTPTGCVVALRKESVDRNNVQPRKTEVPGVALRKESVDRNSLYAQYRHLTERRSPQGERG